MSKQWQDLSVGGMHVRPTPVSKLRWSQNLNTTVKVVFIHLIGIIQKTKLVCYCFVERRILPFHIIPTHPMYTNEYKTKWAVFSLFV